MRAPLAVLCLLSLAALAAAQKPKTKNYGSPQDAATAATTISKMVRPRGWGPRAPDCHVCPPGGAHAPPAASILPDLSIQCAGEGTPGSGPQPLTPRRAAALPPPSRPAVPPPLHHKCCSWLRLPAGLPICGMSPSPLPV